MAKFIANMRHDLRVYLHMWRLQYRAAWKLRGAFTLQVVGMIVNNVGLLAGWLFLFSRFGTINGWSGADFIGVQGLNMLIFGTMLIFNAGLPELPRYVDHGVLDMYLTKPTSVLTQLAASAAEVAAFGDVTLGLGLVIWYVWFIGAGIVPLLMLLTAIVIGIILMWCFTLLPFLLAFYIFDSDKVARNIAFFYLDIGIYPSGVLSGGLRTIFLTVFPGMFIGVVPLEVVRDIKWEYLLLGLVVAGTWLAITLWAFRRSIRRYESANLVGAR